MKTIIAIDPGTTQSAVVHWDIDSNKPISGQIMDNCVLLAWGRSAQPEDSELWAVEMIASYGMPVGKEVFETVLLIGQIKECCLRQSMECRLIYRRDVKLHHCGSAKAKDGNIIQALKDKYGDKGTKNNPGPFYGFKADMWQAAAIAAYVAETTTTPCPTP